MFIAWLAAVWIAGCAASGSRGSAADDTFTLPPGSGATDKPGPGAGSQTVTGVLSFDDVEGGCGFLETADGARFEVLYPAGWQLDVTAGVLRGPDGRRVAAGTTVTVRGSVATDRSSTCQVGTIFQATTVEVAGA